MEKIIFENGTKISDAKVTIGQQDYIVVPAEYDGTTPLSAEVLNIMQDNIEEGIDQAQQDILDTLTPHKYILVPTVQIKGRNRV